MTRGVKKHAGAQFFQRTGVGKHQALSFERDTEESFFVVGRSIESVAAC